MTAALKRGGEITRRTKRTDFSTLGLSHFRCRNAFHYFPTVWPTEYTKTRLRRCLGVYDRGRLGSCISRLRWTPPNAANLVGATPLGGGILMHERKMLTRLGEDHPMRRVTLNGRGSHNLQVQSKDAAVDLGRFDITHFTRCVQDVRIERLAYSI